MEDKVENQTPNQTQPESTAPVTPAAFPNPQVDPAPEVIQPTDPPKSTGSDKPAGKNNALVWIVVALIILVLILAGVYFYLTQSTTKPVSTLPQPAAQTPKEDMQTELNSLDVASEGEDFAEVDKDLQQL